LVIVIVSAIINDITFSCLGQPVNLVSSVFLLYKQMELLALKYLVMLKKLVIKAGNVS
ncbi:hypothetical protein GW17_00053027, partial [Ensete ventricosum]